MLLSPGVRASAQAAPLAGRLTHVQARLLGVGQQTARGGAELQCWSPYPHSHLSTLCPAGDSDLQTFTLDRGLEQGVREELALPPRSA